MSSALCRRVGGQAGPLVPIERSNAAAASEPLWALKYGNFAQRPVVAAHLLHPNVHYNGFLAGLADGPPAVEQLPQYKSLGRTLFESAHVHQTSGQHLAACQASH